MFRSISLGFFVAVVTLSCLRSNSLVEAKSANFTINNENLIAKTEPQTLIVAGGWDQGPLRSIELLDLPTRTWKTGTNMILKRSDAGYAVLNGQLHVVGGRVEGEGRYQDTPNMETYDAENDVWAESTSMQNSRSRLGLAAINGYLYALGGFDGSAPVDTVEQYDPIKAEWSYSPSMILKTEMFGLAVVNSVIYVIGGRDHGGSMNRVQKYDPNTRTWSFIPDMLKKRVGPGVAVWHNQIFVLGGLSGVYDTEFLNSIEYYDMNINKWVCSLSMPEQRAFFGVVSYNNMLYAVGGKNSTVHAITTTQVFDPVESSYFYITSRMQQGRAGHVTALI